MTFPAGKVRIQSSSASTQSQLNSTSTQTTEHGTTQLKLVCVFHYALMHILMQCSIATANTAMLDLKFNTSKLWNKHLTK